MDWLPEPPKGTRVALGFDGSDVDDWTCIAAETEAGYSFTPRFAGGPTIWRPDQHGGRIPRDQVDTAVAELFDRFDVARMYCDPPRYETDVANWALRHGEKRVLPWETYRTRQMYAALERFVADLAEGRVKQDGCPLTQLAMDNAKRAAKSSDQYVLMKPSRHQKIDPAMARVLAHEAACDARAAEWGKPKRKNARMIVLS